MNTKIKSILFLNVFFLALFISCNKDELEMSETEKTESSKEIDMSQVSSKSYGSYPVCTDRSGRVKVRVFYRNIQGQNNSTSVSVGAGYSLVGGGAAASREGEGRGYASGLLMGSAPLFDGKTWRASSKDHGYADRHFLTVYAIGLQIDGVSESELTNNILVLDSRNGPSNRPHGAKKLPGDYILIGGGAYLEQSSGARNLLISSACSTYNEWSATGKDHMYAGSDNIYTYVIGMKRSFLDRLNIEVVPLPQSSTSINGGYANVSSSIYDSVVVGIGVNSLSFAGRPLTQIIPRCNKVSGQSKDHGYAAGGALKVHGFALRGR